MLIDIYVARVSAPFKLMVTLQSGCVPEILTLCRMKEIFFQKYHEKENIHSFPTMHNTMGSKVDGLWPTAAKSLEKLPNAGKIGQKLSKAAKS